jgi:DeoR/GlpR family transcriptional regulator of sugar metabolism
VTLAERTWFADERHAEVLRLLAIERCVESSRLARHFGVSAESIRKDLAQLEARGLHRGLTTPDPDEAHVKQMMLVTDDAITAQQRKQLPEVDVTVEVAH